MENRNRQDSPSKLRACGRWEKKWGGEEGREAEKMDSTIKSINKKKITFWAKFLVLNDQHPYVLFRHCFCYLLFAGVWDFLMVEVFFLKVILFFTDRKLKNTCFDFRKAFL